MILIVEDDDAIQNSLKELLMMKGYDVVQAFSYQQALNAFNKNIQFVLIDIQLPGGNGISLCQKIRDLSSVPILFLTAKDDEGTIVEALNRGGDDYIIKPFRASELIARIKSIMRRTIKNDVIVIDDLVIDTQGYHVYKNDEEIILSAISYEMLFLFVKYQKMVMTRERLTELIEEKTGHMIENNTVSVHIKRMREKLGTYQGKDYIETVRGVGYRWKQE
jgi:Response regulators consisting of a CheY-like receiver domain and a winged-helix DNA-binding domain